MLGITRQVTGCTLLSNGVLLLDPIAFLEARGVDPDALAPDTCNLVVQEHLFAAEVGPVRHVILIDPAWN